MIQRAGILPGDDLAVMGFRVPALPVARETTLSPQLQLAQLMRRFAVFTRALHVSSHRRAIALHIVAHPERSRLGAEVGVYVLCRVTDPNYTNALTNVTQLAQQVYQLFPTEGLFNYDMPSPLSKEELREATFQVFPSTGLDVVELRKYEEETIIYALEKPDAQPQRGYVFHPFWADTYLDPWLNLIEILSRASAPTVISIALEPTSLVSLPEIADRVEKLRMVVEYGEQRRTLFFQNAQIAEDTEQGRTIPQVLALVRVARALGLSDFDVAQAQRGVYAYQQLLAGQDQLFKMRVTVAARGEADTALVQAVRAALCFSAADNPGSELGWIRPEAIHPLDETQRAIALRNLQWVDHQDWGLTGETAQLRHVRHLVTAREAVGIFHLPMMPQAGQTSALSTVDVPFVIPPEVASTSRFKPGEPLISLGYLYQRNRWLAPDEVGEANAVPFQVRVSDLEKPSLLVGSPGSGKSNLALYILQQLGQMDIPFLVLDPSTGHEYRYLYAADALKDHLVVYTTGDEDGFPFRFNPFAVPPGVTVRAHITRLLSCFKAAYEMWDPLPAIYEAALARVYTQAPFAWDLDEKGPLAAGRAFPCLSDFAQAVIDEVEENVLPDYGKGTEAGGILTGASKIRVRGILNSLGRVLNVRQDDPLFFQRLLQKPVVIELGALGDPSSLALVMAFLVTQLVGHIEYAYQQRKDSDKPHLLLIDEAHRLLSAEAGATASQNQGNTRGKSAEEMNTMLAEVRKFRQGIMILDQRPSSLVGGVLDNALINIMCRLNDRSGFEHLSHVLNLDPAQQRYARTRLRAGQTLVLDASSGLPVLLRAPLVVDVLRGKNLSLAEERRRMADNAREAGVLCPEAIASVGVSCPKPGGGALEGVWYPLLDSLRAEVLSDIEPLILAGDSDGARRVIRAWLMQSRRTVNPLMEKTVLLQILLVMKQDVGSVQNWLTTF